MRKRELTQAQKDYREFDNRRCIIVKFLIIFLVALLVCLVTAFHSADDYPILVPLFLGILIAYTIITIFVCRHLARKHGELYVAAFESHTDIIHTGVFGKLWEEFECNQFEGLTDGKVVFVQAHNNIIDLSIIRHKHEFDITIDSDAIYIVMDEETDSSVEREIPLSEMTEVDQVFVAIREFVESV